MLPFIGPFFYKCNDCGKVFEKTEKIHIVDIAILNMLANPKCPKCGSKNTKLMNYTIKE